MNCWIDIKVREVMIKEGLRKFPLETGGILCGYRGENGDYAITDIIGPGDNAFHSPVNFEGDTNYQQSEFDTLWRKSDGTIWYLGDWHTHPNGPTSYSDMDFNCMRTIAGNMEAQAPEPLMIIIGGKVDDFKVYRFVKDQVEILPLYEFDYEKYLASKEI